MQEVENEVGLQGASQPREGRQGSTQFQVFSENSFGRLDKNFN